MDKLKVEVILDMTSDPDFGPLEHRVIYSRIVEGTTDGSTCKLDTYTVSTINFAVDWEAKSLNTFTNTPNTCLLYTSPSPRDRQKSRMPSSA